MNFICIVCIVYIWFQTLLFCLFVLINLARIFPGSGSTAAVDLSVSVDSGYLVFIYRWLATQIIVSFHPEHCLGKIFPILMDTPIFAIFRWCSKPPPVPVMDLEHRLKLWSPDRWPRVHENRWTTGVLLVKAVSDRKGVRVGKGAGSSRIRIRRELCHRFFTGDSEIKTCHLKMWKSFPKKSCKKNRPFLPFCTILEIDKTVFLGLFWGVSSCWRVVWLREVGLVFDTTFVSESSRSNT